LHIKKINITIIIVIFGNIDANNVEKNDKQLLENLNIGELSFVKLTSIKFSLLNSKINFVKLNLT
jgi:hypothetical protein